MKTQEIRTKFTQFFIDQGHTLITASKLVADNDPTLLFVNAGMVPFKNAFLGQERYPHNRVTSIQPCVRAGGKHNDLENVGYTARHHTFFEMLGNFSFGDYFKQAAIAFAWQFLTEVLSIAPEKLWVTVFEEDDEAADIWLNQIGVSARRFSRIGAKDNFWSMGDVGPCGPCTEIFYDHGADVSGDPPGTTAVESDRYVEIWNLVFMQYDRQADGTLQPLSKPSVDTGMGLERLAAVMQGVHSNYDIDLFQHLIQATMKLSSISDNQNQSLRVIADHIRACAFLIKDGVSPSNEGQGYVLRRIIRRAIRHGHKIGIKTLFFYQLVAPLIEVMGAAYPALEGQRAMIETTLQQEEQQFIQTLEQGLAILTKVIQSAKQQIAGDVVFKLYDTYGFPVDLTADIAREQGLSIDLVGFEACMAKQRARAKSTARFSTSLNQKIRTQVKTEFNGYQHLLTKTKVAALFNIKGESVTRLELGEQGIMVLPTSPFYAEAGGQIGDRGTIKVSDGSAEFAVNDTQKAGDAIIHHGMVVTGTFKLGQCVDAQVDVEARQAIMRSHSATHLLHTVLRDVLGQHVEQKGSLVEPDRLRFDFSHRHMLTPEQWQMVEDDVNRQIRNNIAAEVITTSMAQAQQLGAIALFGEKYGDHVRVLKFGDVSIELCGGCHVQRTGDIGYIKIVSETGIATGVRRIEALTGELAVSMSRLDHDTLKQIGKMLATATTDTAKLVDKIATMSTKFKQQEKQLHQLEIQLAAVNMPDLTAQAITVAADVQLLAVEVSDVEVKALRGLLDDLKTKLSKAVIVLGIKDAQKVNLIAGVTDNLTDRVKAGDLIRFVAAQVGGRGGGRADMAQAGGTQPEHLQAALASVADWLASILAKQS